MIKLIDILRESSEQPKAIFLAGPAGAGKTTILSKFPELKHFTIINVDDTYEELLKKSDLGMSHKDFNSDELSQAAKLMHVASKATKEKYQSLSNQKKNVIIDGTGSSTKPLLTKKIELEALGYKTLMLMVWVSPMVSLDRNANRERSLMPQIVLRTWRDVTKNIEDYRKIFKDNFILIDNNPEDSIEDYTSVDIKNKFFHTAKTNLRIKTPEETAKSDAMIKQMNDDVDSLIKQRPQFTSIDDAKTTLTAFIQ